MEVHVFKLKTPFNNIKWHLKLDSCNSYIYYIFYDRR